MRKETRRFVALAMALCMLFSMVGGVSTGVRAEESASYTSEVDVTLYVGQTVTYEVDATTVSVAADSNIASVTIDNVGDAQLGTESTFSDDRVYLESALYTFTATDTDCWVISNTTSDGTTVYVNIDDSNNGYPNNTTSDILTLTLTSAGFTITNGSNRNLAFLNGSSSYSGKEYTFDEGNAGKGDTGVLYNFYIYRQATDSEDSSTELPGYVKVTSLNDISSGSQYLIVAYRDGSYYALYPSTSTSSTTGKYSHVAKVLGSVKADMTITGVAVGTTSVTVGDTTYNITVQAAPEVTETVTYETSPFVGNTGSTTSGKGKVVTRLTVDEGTSYDLDIADSYSGTVIWVSSDTSVATVDQNGTVTGVSAGTTYVTAIIDGVKYSIEVIVIDDCGSTWTCDFYIAEIVNTDVIYVLNNSTTDTSEMTVAEQGEVVYITFNYPFCVNFFAKEEDGYALTAMKQTNSAGDYYALYVTGDVTTLDAYTYSSSALAHQMKYTWSESGYDDSAALIKTMLESVIDAGYHGTLGNTRGSSNPGGLTTNFSFYSRKLPTVTKEITSITHDGTTTAYTEGMTAEASDVITYKVTVTQYATDEAIVYDNVTLTDTLTDATFTISTATYADGYSYVVPDLSDSAVSEDITYSYEVTYTIKTDDIDTTITNTVALSYDYSSQYSSGTYGGIAEAEASLNMSTFTPDDIVIDFGLPVTIDYSNDRPASGTSSIKEGSATYGEITVTGGNVITYTPTSVLPVVDTVTLVSQGGATATFNVYPATTVYYEEGFADYGTGWSVASGGNWSGTTTVSYSSGQEANIAEKSGNGYNNYGYDGAYVNDNSGSNGTAATTTTVADSLSFTFTGTGVDIFANCDSDSGRVAIRIAESDSGTIKKFLFVDMANTGTYSSGDSTTAYNTPIASVSGLTYGSYTVTIYLVTAGDSGFRFDGFRVYDTIDNDSTVTAGDAYTIQTTVYQEDDEDYPVYYELRDYVLAGLNVSATDGNTIYASDIAASTTAQVYSSDTNNISGAVVYYDESSTDNSVLQSGTDVQDLLDDGPKNELYLYTGMTVVFKITTNREVQIGLRSVTGDSVSYTVTASTTGSVTSYTGGKTITSTVDMFYTLQEKNANGEVTYTITVPSGSSGVLSITDIKVCDCPDETIIGELTEEDLTAALVSIGYAADEEPVTYADATLTTELTDYTGTVLATTALAENGVEGESAVFAASDILEAVNAILPNGYALVSADSITDQTVVYGEDSVLSVQIGKVATLTITYQKYTGLFRKTTVATVTLTKVQTDRSSRATFSVSEIRATVPAGCRVLLVTSASVNYGMNGSKTIICY